MRTGISKHASLLRPLKTAQTIERLEREITAKDEAVTALRSQLIDKETKVEQLRRSNDGLREKLRRALATIETIEPAFKHYQRVFSFADATAEAATGTRFDLCIAHDTLALEAARSVVEAQGCPLVFDAVEHPELSARGRADEERVRRCRKTRLLQLGLDAVMREAALTLATSRPLADLCEREKGLRPPIVVRNCRRYEPPIADPRIREDCGLAEGQRLLLYPNDVQSPAMLELALAALARLPSHVHLALMGQLFVEVRKEAPRLIERYGVGDRLHLLDVRPPDDFIGYRSGADAALIILDPDNRNHYLSLPNRLFEAVMSRLPVGATDLPAMTEVIRAFGCGLVFQNDAVSLAAACERLLEEARYKDAVRAAAEQLNWERERLVLEEALRPLLPPSGGSVLFLANKKIRVNDRCARFVGSLVEMGHQVQVIALDEPAHPLRHKGVDYTVVEA